MKRYYILEDDLTTSGGIVQKHTGAASTTSWYGRTRSVIGDRVNCPACKSVGTIQPALSRLNYSDHGLMPALNDDLCICRCSPPPKLIHSQSVFYETVSEDSYVNNSELQLQQNLTGSFQYGQRYLLVDDLTAEPLSNICYEIYKSGSACIHGKTDENGYTEAVLSENDEEIEIMIHTEDGDHNGYCCK